MYAKLIDNKVEFAPKNKGSILNYDLDIEQMLADGYKLFVEVERPETNRLYHIGYEETADEILEVIVYDETQEEADAREAQQERERIARLSCTKRDFVLLLQEQGITYPQLKTLIAQNEQAQMEWDLCERLYRFNPLLDVMGAQLGVSSEMLDYIFRKANGEIEDEVEGANTTDK